MPNGVPIVLTAEQRGLYATIGSYFSQGVGADRTYKALQNTDNYIPRAKVREIFTELRASLGVDPRIARIPLNQQLPESIVKDNSSLKTNNYIHLAHIEIRDKVTGFTATQKYTYSSPTLASQDEVLDAIAEDGGGDGNYYENDQIAVTVVAVYHR